MTTHEQTRSSSRPPKQGEAKNPLTGGKKKPRPKTLTGEEIEMAFKRRYSPRTSKSAKLFEGQKIARLSLRFCFKAKQGPQWICDCDCGSITAVSASHIRTGHTTSCGCFRVENTVRIKTRHGLTAKRTRPPEYRIWSAMIQRCNNPNNKSYKNYGARGIHVCDRWMIFENFYNDIGTRPCIDATLDRIDNNGGYEKSNCRWTTLETQANNKRNNIQLTLYRVTKTASQWSKELGIRAGVIYGRKSLGWSDYRILTTPIQKR